jgi:hypothetical protein
MLRSSNRREGMVLVSLEAREKECMRTRKELRKGLY